MIQMRSTLERKQITTQGKRIRLLLDPQPATAQAALARCSFSLILSSSASTMSIH